MEAATPTLSRRVKRKSRGEKDESMLALEYKRDSRHAMVLTGQLWLAGYAAQSVRVRRELKSESEDARDAALL